MRILIADNNTDLLEMLVIFFEANGWEVTAAKDGREALYFYHQLIHHEKYFDVLLLDVEMPRLNGFAVGVNVRNLESLSVAPRAVHVYLTGHADLVAPETLISILFADGYVHKPFDPKELLAKINSLVKEKANGMGH